MEILLFIRFLWDITFGMVMFYTALLIGTVISVAGFAASVAAPVGVSMKVLFPLFVSYAAAPLLFVVVRCLLAAADEAAAFAMALFLEAAALVHALRRLARRFARVK